MNGGSQSCRELGLGCTAMGVQRDVRIVTATPIPMVSIVAAGHVARACHPDVRAASPVVACRRPRSNRRKPKGSMLSRAAVSSAIVIACLTVWLGSAQPVAAECNPPGADLSFRRAVPLAQRVVIGTVTEVRPDGVQTDPSGASARFTLTVTRVLRGDSPDAMAIEFLETNGCIRWVRASVGDTIALALDVGRAEPPVATNTAAWISARPARSAFEAITMAGAIALARMVPPDTSMATGTRPDTFVPLLPIVLGAAGALAALLRRPTRRIGRRRPLVD